MKKRLLLLCFVFCFKLFLLNAKELELKYFQTDQRYTYRIELLKIALEETSELGEYKLKPVEFEISQLRGIELLKENKVVNIAFLPTNHKREEELLPIRIPILQGILGYRLFLIREEDQDKFSKINTLKELTEEFKAGFGAQWADMRILKENKIPTVTSVKYKNLFTMLKHARFDYFPRGINEIWKENKAYPQLAIEKNLAFYYPFAVYFFVNKKNKETAHRIKLGLKRALKNGKFKKLFLKFHNKFIRKANLTKRKIFLLNNSNYPGKLPDFRKDWYFNLK